MSDPVAAGVLLSAPSGRALFMKRSEKTRDHAGTWSFPFGSIEGGETPEQTALRETGEETGITGLTTGDLTKIDDGDGYVTFRASTGDEPVPVLNDEHTEHRWASLDDPPQPLHPGVASTLKKLAGVSKDVALDKREWDTNGWFEVLDNPLSTVGVYTYSEAAVIEGGDPKKKVNVYRPAEELSDPETIKSFRLMPWTDDHPSRLLGAAERELVPAEEKGVHGVIGEQTYYRDGTLYGNIKVFSEQLARKISGGKRELSCGYRCDFVPQEGVYDGAAYQYVQKNLRGNHVASVKVGRMGSGVRVLDAAEFFTFALDLKEPDMAVCKECGRTHDATEDCMDAETARMVSDSFNSLVEQLEGKGYSKEYATKVAGKVAAEKGKTGHDSTSTGDIAMAKDANVKDPEGKEDPSKKDDLKGGAGATRDGMTEEEESGMDAKADEEESAKDAAEEEADKDKDDKEARDRKSARDRRAGARDARQSARDRKSARDAKAAKDAEEEAKKGKGMDAAEVTALVRREVAKASPDTASLVKIIRKEEAAKSALYGRISPIIGAFDHAEMTHAEMASYGLKKLGVTVDSGDPVTGLDFYLAGRTHAAAPPRAALDAKTGLGESFLDKYLAG